MLKTVIKAYRKTVSKNTIYLAQHVLNFMLTSYVTTDSLKAKNYLKTGKSTISEHFTENYIIAYLNSKTLYIW